ncbi:uncharacterized protein LOC125072118 [Vanessa atalanta]|uniref:uncharacterized protein LOC125072118 n=1 Tax=Vanessa atalanta TaxID=42275 RepID=UPI001FCD6626|nr:uncharacterized protein LOC125072118 [Vanessa atalanta]
MELTCKHTVIQLNSDTIHYLRKLYNLDNPERLEASIDILVKWLQKQDHFIKKDFSKEYLERAIIFSKGSVERAKLKLDKTSTFKTLLPRYFQAFDVKKATILQNILCGIVPKLTKDHNRIVVTKNVGDNFSRIIDFYKYTIMICEYVNACEYCDSFIVVFDARGSNIMDYIKFFSPVDMQQCISILIEGYKMRVKGFHFLTPSKSIDTLISIFKRALSPKLRQRIQIHRDLESLHKYVPKEIMPSDLGGQEKSIKELHDDLMNIMTSDEFTAFLNDMRLAATDETCRSDDKFNDQYMGMPGSFRKLNID